MNRVAGTAFTTRAIETMVIVNVKLAISGKHANTSVALDVQERNVPREDIVSHVKMDFMVSGVPGIVYRTVLNVWTIIYVLDANLDIGDQIAPRPVAMVV